MTDRADEQNGSWPTEALTRIAREHLGLLVGVGTLGIICLRLYGVTRGNLTSAMILAQNLSTTTVFIGMLLIPVTYLAPLVAFVLIRRYNSLPVGHPWRMSLLLFVTPAFVAVAFAPMPVVVIFFAALFLTVRLPTLRAVIFDGAVAGVGGVLLLGVFLGPMWLPAQVISQPLVPPYPGYVISSNDDGALVMLRSGLITHVHGIDADQFPYCELGGGPGIGNRVLDSPVRLLWGKHYPACPNP